MQKGAVKTALTQGRGGITPIETLSRGLGQGERAAPRGDYDQRRFGPEIQAANVELREKTALALFAAAIGSPALYTSQGAALREAHRHFLTDTCKGLGNLIAAELSEKLEQEIVFTWPEIFRSDISARSRAYNALMQGGALDAERIERIVGLPL